MAKQSDLDAAKRKILELEELVRDLRAEKQAAERRAEALQTVMDKMPSSVTDEFSRFIHKVH